jgi:DNA-binding winged helix-turn-helix (wHTH) protein/TolB-like protein
MAYEFGPFRYEPGERALYRGAEVVSLTPKAVDLLAILIERRGQVVGRDELMRRLWPDTTVEETGLARNVSLLRKALGDDGESAAYIETLPKRGYRFIGVLNRPKRPRWPVAAGIAVALLAGLVYWQFYVPGRYVEPARGRPYLAIVPLEMLGAEPEAGFERAFNEAYAAALVGSGQVQLLSPSTVARYQRWHVSTSVMARLIGVDVLIEGSVENRGDTCRATARLADVHTAKLVGVAQLEAPETEAPALAGRLARITLKLLKLKAE